MGPAAEAFKIGKKDNVDTHTHTNTETGHSEIVAKGLAAPTFAQKCCRLNCQVSSRPEVQREP